jgi:hypothetical protein
MKMISALLMTAVLAQSPVYVDQPVVRHVVVSEETAVLTGFPWRGSCNTGCVVNSGYVVHDPGLYLTLQNIPGGVETKREYVRCKVFDKYYTLPVINGYLPSVTVRSTNDLVLNYGTGVVYHSSMYGGKSYIAYNSTTARKPEAVKTFEGVESVKKVITSGPTGVHHPDTLTTPVQEKAKVPSDEEIDSLLNRAPTKAATMPTGAHRPSDAEVDSLLKKPSSVPDTSSQGFPRY